MYLCMIKRLKLEGLSLFFTKKFFYKFVVYYEIKYVVFVKY